LNTNPVTHRKQIHWSLPQATLSSYVAPTLFLSDLSSLTVVTNFPRPKPNNRISVGGSI
jgi:hypothetical protein